MENVVKNIRENSGIIHGIRTGRSSKIYSLKVLDANVDNNLLVLDVQHDDGHLYGDINGGYGLFDSSDQSSHQIIISQNDIKDHGNLIVNTQSDFINDDIGYIDVKYHLSASFSTLQSIVDNINAVQCKACDHIFDYRNHTSAKVDKCCHGNDIMIAAALVYPSCGTRNIIHVEFIKMHSIAKKNICNFIRLGVCEEASIN